MCFCVQLAGVTGQSLKEAAPPSIEIEKAPRQTDTV